MNRLFLTDSGRSRTINAENPTGAKGMGGTAASHLGGIHITQIMMTS